MIKLVVKKYCYSLLYYDKVSRKEIIISLLIHIAVLWQSYSRKEISFLITVPQSS